MSTNLSIALMIGASVGSAIAGINRVKSTISTLKDQSVSTSEKLRTLGKMTALGVTGSITGIKAASSSVMGLAGPAMRFESAMADVKKVVDFKTPEQFKEMSNDILAMTRRIPMAKEEIAAIVAAGGQAGVAREHLLGYAEDAAKMGVAFDIAAGEAGEAMATLSNVLGKPIKEMASFGDAINHLSDNANAKAKDIVNVMVRAGSDTRMLGLTENQGAALSSTFLSMGKAPELAAQAIKGMSSAFAELKAGKHAEELKMLGLSPKSFAKTMNKDAQGAISDFIERVKKLPKDKQYPILAKMFGKQYADDMMLLAQNTEEYNRQLNLLEEKNEKGELKYKGSMEREFESRSSTTENGLRLLQNSTEELFTAIGARLLPIIQSVAAALAGAVHWVTDFTKQNEWLVDIIIYVGGAIAGLVTGFSALSAVIGGAGMLWLGMAKPIGMFINGLGKTMKWLKSIALLIVKFGGTMLSMAATFAKALFMMGRALLMSPIGLAITAIAVGAYLIYQYWEPIKAFFVKLWQGITDKFSAAWEWIKSAWSGVGDWVSEAWAGVTTFFTNLWENIKTLASQGIDNIANFIRNFDPLALFKSAFESVLSWFGIDLPASFSGFGTAMIDNLIGGIKSAWESTKGFFTDLGNGIKEAFTFDVKTTANQINRTADLATMGPVFSSGGFTGAGGKYDPAGIVHKGEYVLTKDATERIGVSNLDRLNYGGQSPQGLFANYQPLSRQPATQSSTSGAVTVHFNPTITITGNQDQSLVSQIQQALLQNSYEFEQLFKRVLDQQQRVAY